MFGEVSVARLAGATSRRTGSLLAVWVLIGAGLSLRLPGPAEGASLCPGSRFTCPQLVAAGLDYPFKREASSFLFVNGVAYPYVKATGSLLGDSVVRAQDKRITSERLLGKLGLANERSKHRTPVVGYGSNASVFKLSHQFVNNPFFSGDVVIPTMKARLKNYDVVWGPRFTSLGGLAATVVRSPGTEVEVWINWLDDAQLARMDQTEDVGEAYSKGYLYRPRLTADGPNPRKPAIYVDCDGAVRSKKQFLSVSTVRARGRRFPAVDSAGVISTIRPTVGWNRSVFELLLDNVQSAERRHLRTKQLQVRVMNRQLAGYRTTVGCSPP